jgi:predicted nucleic acid-binding protein
VTSRITLDSSIIISHLAGDVHKDDVLAAIERLLRSKTELFLPLICYAEVWTGIELSERGKRRHIAREFHNLIRSSGIMIVSDNVEIAREAARCRRITSAEAGREKF